MYVSYCKDGAMDLQGLFWEHLCMIACLLGVLCTRFVWVCFSYKPYFFSQRIIFFSHTKSVNSTFSHGLSAKQAQVNMMNHAQVIKQSMFVLVDVSFFVLGSGLFFNNFQNIFILWVDSGYNDWITSYTIRLSSLDSKIFVFYFL